jgi:exonuclease III
MSTLKTKIIGSNNYFSLISLTINGLNSPIKRHRLKEWLHKQDPTFCCLPETHLREKDRHYLRLKSWKTIFQANDLKKQAGVDILISNKSDFQPKVIKKDKEGHFILINGKIFQEEFSILTINAPNARAATFTKKNFSKAQSTHCTSHNNSGRLQHTTFINGQIMEREIKQGHRENNRSDETNVLNRYLENILS